MNRLKIDLAVCAGVKEQNPDKGLMTKKELPNGRMIKSLLEG